MVIFASTDRFRIKFNTFIKTISAEKWIRLRRLRKSYNVMIQLCLVVVDKRSEALRRMRKFFWDRKLMVCAYALMNKQEHVMMLDCWRRLKIYLANRQKWKAFRWNYNIEYHQNKTQGPFTHIFFISLNFLNFL